MTPSEQDAWDYSEQNSLLREEQVATGITRHPVNGIWQVWVSLYGHDVSQIFASQHYPTAKAVLQQFNQEWNSNRLATLEAMTDFCQAIKSREGSEPIDPLPRSSVKAICQLIKDTKQKR
ncbi:MAG: hypothetical protein JO235_02275, partial [Chroococcidiopsidaceae cyanobacterium CP_BM_RX_35]|nr:hypothetical protein [Chroococcidiopsidaceae cyanobacterium CP_BM_RX_35]